MDPKLLGSGLLLFLLVTVNGRAQSGSVGPSTEDSVMIRRLADTILTDSRTYGNLRTLTKTVGARLSGSPGYYKAEKWGQQALEAADADRVWLQECMVPHWVRGGKDVATWRRAGGAEGGGHGDGGVPMDKYGWRGE